MTKSTLKSNCAPSGRVGHPSRGDVRPRQEVEQRVEDRREHRPRWRSGATSGAVSAVGIAAAARRRVGDLRGMGVAHDTTFMKPSM